MSDERPRPQYGEYATPEQQAKAAGLKFDPKAAARAIQEAQAAQAAQADRAIPHPPPEAAPEPESRVPGRSPFRTGVRVAHPVDRFFTFFLLGVGIFYLLTSVPSYLSFTATLDAGYQRFGAGKFPEPDLGNQVGIWMLVAHSILFILTITWALRRLAHGRRAAFVPIIGFVLFVAVFVAAFFVLYAAEPSYFKEVSDTMFGTSF